MTVPEIWPGQDRGGKKKKKKMNSRNLIKHPLQGSLNNSVALKRVAKNHSVHNKCYRKN